jgi:hypothetical protein
MKACLCIGLLTADLWAGQMMLQTTDGKSYEGEGRFLEGVFSVGGTTVAPENLRRLRLNLTNGWQPAAGAQHPPPSATTTPPARNGTRLRVILPTSEAAPQIWRYTTNKPSVAWVNSDFDDSSWSSGPAGFGEPSTPHGIVRTRWKTGTIWLRRKFTLEAIPTEPRLRIFHDEDAAVYLNGKRVLVLPGNSDGYLERPMESLARDVMRVGNNLLAVRCVNKVGGQNIDAGLLDAAATGVQEPRRPEEVRKQDESIKQDAPAGVVLTSGSIIARRAHFVDDRMVRFSDSDRDPTLALSAVARLHFQPVSAGALARVPPGQAGLLLADGEFFEAEFKGLANGKVRTSSVLYGLKEFEAGRVAAVILREVRAASARFEVLTVNGGRILASRFRVEPEGIVLEDAGVVGFKIRRWEMAEIRRRE